MPMTSSAGWRNPFQGEPERSLRLHGNSSRPLGGGRDVLRQAGGQAGDERCRYRRQSRLVHRASGQAGRRDRFGRRVRTTKRPPSLSGEDGGRERPGQRDRSQAGAGRGRNRAAVAPGHSSLRHFFLHRVAVRRLRPYLVHNSRQVRAWVGGCSSGSTSELR